MNKYQLRNLFATNMVPVLNLKKLLHPIVQDSIYGSFVGESVVTHDVETPEKLEDVGNEFYSGKTVNGKVSPNTFEEPFYYLDEEGNKRIKQNDSNTTRMELTGVLTPEFDLFLHEIQRYLNDEFLFDPIYNTLLTDNEKNDRLENACSFLGFSSLKNSFIKLSSEQGVEVAFSLLEDLVMYRKLATTDSWKKILESYFKSSLTTTGIFDLAFADIKRETGTEYVCYPNNAPILVEEILIALRKNLEEYLKGNIETNIVVTSSNTFRPIDQISSFGIGKTITYEGAAYHIKGTSGEDYLTDKVFDRELVNKQILVSFTTDKEDISFNHSNAYIKVLSSNSFEFVNDSYKPYLTIGDKIYSTNIYSNDFGFSAFASITQIIGDTYYISNTFEDDVIGTEIKISLDVCIEKLEELNDIKTISRLESISDFTPYIKLATSMLSSEMGYNMTYDIWSGNSDKIAFNLENQKQYIIKLFKVIRSLSLNFDAAIKIDGNFPYLNYYKVHENRYLMSKNFSQFHISLDDEDGHLYRYVDGYNRNIDTDTYIEKLTTYEHVDTYHSIDKRIYASKLGSTRSNVMLQFGSQFMKDVNNQSLASIYEPKSLLEITGVNNGSNSKNVQEDYSNKDLKLNFAVFSDSLSKKENHVLGLNGPDEITHIILGNSEASQYDFNYKKYLVPDKYGAAIYGKSVYKEHSKKFNMSDINFSTAVAKFPVLQTISTAVSPITDDTTISSNIGILADFEQYFNHMKYADLPIFKDIPNNTTKLPIATFNTYDSEFECKVNESLDAEAHTVTNDLSLILNEQNRISNNYISINVLVGESRYYNLNGIDLTNVSDKLRVEFRNYNTTVRMPIIVLGPSLEDYLAGAEPSYLEQFAEFLSPFNKTVIKPNICYFSFTEKNVKFAFYVDGRYYYGTVEFDKAFLRLVDWTYDSERRAEIFTYPIQMFVGALNYPMLNFAGLKNVEPVLNSDEITYKIGLKNTFARVLIEGENKYINLADEEDSDGEISIYEETDNGFKYEGKADKSKMKYLASKDEFYKDYSLVRLEDITDEFSALSSAQTQALTNNKFFRIKDKNIREKIRFGSSTNVISENEYKLLNISNLKGNENPKYFSKTRKLSGVITGVEGNTITLESCSANQFSLSSRDRIMSKMNSELVNFVDSVDKYPKVVDGTLQKINRVSIDTSLANSPKYYNFATMVSGALDRSVLRISEQQKLSSEVLNQFYETYLIYTDQQTPHSVNKTLYKIIASSVEDGKNLITFIYKHDDVYEFETYSFTLGAASKIQEFTVDCTEDKRILKEVIYLSSSKIAISFANASIVGSTVEIYDYSNGAIVSSGLSTSTMTEAERIALKNLYFTTPVGLKPVFDKAEDGTIAYDVPYLNEDKAFRNFFIQKGRSADIFAIAYEDNTIDVFIRAPEFIQNSSITVASNSGVSVTELWYKREIGPQNIVGYSVLGTEKRLNFNAKYSVIIDNSNIPIDLSALSSGDSIDIDSMDTPAMRDAFIEAAKEYDSTVTTLAQAKTVMDRVLQNGDKRVAFETVAFIMNVDGKSEAEKVATVSSAFRSLLMASDDEVPIDFVKYFVTNENGELKYTHPTYNYNGTTSTFTSAAASEDDVLRLFGEISTDKEEFSASEMFSVTTGNSSNATNYDFVFVDFERTTLIKNNVRTLLLDGSNFEVVNMPLFSEVDILRHQSTFGYPIGKLNSVEMTLRTSNILSAFDNKSEDTVITFFTRDTIKYLGEDSDALTIDTDEIEYKYCKYSINVMDGEVTYTEVNTTEGSELRSMYEHEDFIPFSRVAISNGDSYMRFDGSLTAEGEINKSAYGTFFTMAVENAERKARTEYIFTIKNGYNFDESSQPSVIDYKEENGVVTEMVLSNTEKIPTGNYTFVFKTSRPQRNPYLDGSFLSPITYQVYNLDEALFIEEPTEGRRIEVAQDKNKVYYNYDGDSIQNLKTSNGDDVYKYDENILDLVASNFSLHASSLRLASSYIWPTVEDIISYGDFDFFMTPEYSSIEVQDISMKFTKNLANGTSKLVLTFNDANQFSVNDNITAYITSDDFELEDLGELPYVERENALFNVNDNNKVINEVYLADYGRTKDNTHLNTQAWNKNSLFENEVSKNKNGKLIGLLNVDKNEIVNFGSKEFNYIESTSDENVLEIFDFEKRNLLQTRRKNSYIFSHLFLDSANLSSTSAYGFAKQLDDSLIYSVNLDSIQNVNKDNLLGQYTTYSFRDIYYNSNGSNFGFHMNRFLVKANAEGKIFFKAYLIDSNGKKFEVPNFSSYMNPQHPNGVEVIDGFTLRSGFEQNVLSSVYGTSNNDDFDLKIVASLLEDCSDEFYDIFEIDVTFRNISVESTSNIVADVFEECPIASIKTEAYVGETYFDEFEGAKMMVPFKILKSGPMSSESINCRNIEIRSAVTQYKKTQETLTSGNVKLEFELNNLTTEDEIDITLYDDSSKIGDFKIHLPVYDLGRSLLIYDDKYLRGFYILTKFSFYSQKLFVKGSELEAILLGDNNREASQTIHIPLIFGFNGDENFVDEDIITKKSEAGKVLTNLNHRRSNMVSFNSFGNYYFSSRNDVIMTVQEDLHITVDAESARIDLGRLGIFTQYNLKGFLFRPKYISLTDYVNRNGNIFIDIIKVGEGIKVDEATSLKSPIESLENIYTTIAKSANISYTLGNFNLDDEIIAIDKNVLSDEIEGLFIQITFTNENYDTERIKDQLNEDYLQNIDVKYHQIGYTDVANLVLNGLSKEVFTTVEKNVLEEGVGTDMLQAYTPLGLNVVSVKNMESNSKGYTSIISPSLIGDDEDIFKALNDESTIYISTRGVFVDSKKTTKSEMYYLLPNFSTNGLEVFSTKADDISYQISLGAIDTNSSMLNTGKSIAFEKNVDGKTVISTGYFDKMITYEGFERESFTEIIYVNKNSKPVAYAYFPSLSLKDLLVYTTIYDTSYVPFITEY